MLGKLALLLKGKAAVAILGTLLLAGGGTTAVLAANGAQIQLPLIGQSQLQEHHGNDANDDHGNNQGNNHNGGQQVEGTVSSIDAGHSNFVVKPGQGAAVTVVVNAQTVFEEGLNGFGSLKVGLHIEAKGALQSDGSLLATKVEGQNDDANDNDNQADDQNETELRGTIGSTNAGNSSFVLKLSNGTTKTVIVSAQTVFDGGFHSAADLKAGVFVEVKGNLQSDGSVAAIRVHHEDSSSGNDNGGDDHSGSGGTGSSHGDDNGGSGSNGSGHGSGQ
jgi:Domain of unknown function (DUF5666)